MRPLVVFTTANILYRASTEAFYINIADRFWLWINLFTAHTHGCLLYGSYMALLHGTYQIYNSGLEVQGFPARLGFSFFFPNGECAGS